jgi:FkbM family methyltransferase
VVNALFPIATADPMAFDVPFHDVRYRGNIASSQEWHIYFFGGYELKELALASDLLEEFDGPFVMDVGANIGGHSLAFSQHASEVHSFEPYGPLADQIRASSDRNCISNILIHRFGLGENATTLPYFLARESRNSGAGSFYSGHTDAPEVARLDIVKGDDWVKGRHVDFMKIDVEGFEAHVLAGLRQTLSESEPIVLLEVTESSYSLMEQFGGMSELIPYAYDAYEIVNPYYTLGIFQFSGYALLPIDEVVPRHNSYNIVLVPQSKDVKFRYVVGAAVRNA